MNEQNKDHVPNYWYWLFRGSDGKPGIGRLHNWWLYGNVVIGIALAYLVPLTLKECANAVLLPLAGIIIGLTFAWGGNAQALLQTSEIEDLAGYKKGGLAEYVFVFQTAILLLIVTLITWSIAGLNVFDGVWPIVPSSLSYKSIKLFCFLISGIALRDCWHVIDGTHMLLLYRSKIKIARNASKNMSKESDESLDVADRP
jgi:hypothetical protein